MITIRPSVFCFLGKVAPDLHAMLPAAIRKRLGAVPDVFSFIAVTDDAVDLRLGTQRPSIPSVEGSLQSRLWDALAFSTSAIGNIRVRTDALQRPPEGRGSYQVVRGGPDIYIIQCLSDPMGWEMAFAIAEKIQRRSETPPSAGNARGIFPLFHMPSEDEEAERSQAVTGLHRLEKLVKKGILFPSIVVDRVNRNGYPLERWEDLTELLSDFLALSTASEAAADIWRVFPQVADLHASIRDEDGGGSAGLSSIGLSRFRFNKELLGEELGRIHHRNLNRALADTFSEEPASPDTEESRDFLGRMVSKGLSGRGEGLSIAREEIVEWARGDSTGGGRGLGAWSCAFDRLQQAVFERMGEVSQNIENARQRGQALEMESPLRDTWIARLSVIRSPYSTYLSAGLAGALIGALLGMQVFRVPTAGFLVGAGGGAFLAVVLVSLLRRKLRREVFTLGEFPESTFTEEFSAPRTLERFSRKQRPGRRKTGVSIQLWGELRSQLEPGAKQRIDSMKEQVRTELEDSRREEAELVFLDRAIHGLRESVEAWRGRFSEPDLWESPRGFSGDVFPADGPRRIYEWLHGSAASEASLKALLGPLDPAAGTGAFLERVEEVARVWGRDKAQSLSLAQVLEILDDRPQDLIERLSEASAPLWPRPGDRDELVRCFGSDFTELAKPSDLHHSARDETIFIRVLGCVRSAELTRSEVP